ncbi:PLP-dependent aminotransferase family protein [Acinetobacter sp. S40]|uniref:aminotransferase-like domain-containing protein n=1 Tax=Acinetobacter sp. S40 TaxID=2767434 RepID=UPI00190D0C8F|nr:PLP-dependent aminotransferase family protein [Acinetobacter sp. S40]MBJ9985737.1 PLP-dependent aminotransferase family protein [Acinetobacter sp. S40]
MYKSEQLAQHLRRLIENGSWPVHTRLPSLREQAEISGFSLMTVMNAYQDLEAQGLIYSKEKSGYFVAENAKTQIPQSATIVSLNPKIEINSLVFKYLKSIQSKDIVPFGSAFPDHHLLTPSKLLQVVSQMARDQKSYDQTTNLPPGNLALRKIIAQRYCMQGIPTDADDIVITSGGLDALNLSLQALTRPGDYILLQQTTFYGAWQAAERLGLKVITLPEHAKYGFDLEAFEQVIQHYPIKVCWFMLNAQNPIGFTVSDEIKYKIAKLLHEHKIYLIEDDVYEELFYGMHKPLSMKYFDRGNLVLHCSSFSKTLGAGFRVGWVYAGKYSEQIQHLQLMSTISANALIQNALVEFVSSHHYEKHLRLLRRRLEKNKKRFAQYLKQHLGQCCEIYNFPSGYFLWIKLPLHISSLELYQKLIIKHISLAPSPLFNVLETNQHYIRLNCSFEWTSRIQDALDQFIQSILNFP